MSLETTLEAMNKELANAVTIQEQDRIAEKYNSLIEEAEKQLELQFNEEIEAEKLAIESEIEASLQELKSIEAADDEQILIEKEINDRFVEEYNKLRPTIPDPIASKNNDGTPKNDPFENTKNIIQKYSAKSAARRLRKNDVIDFAKSLDPNINTNRKEIEIIEIMKKLL